MKLAEKNIKRTKFPVPTEDFESSCWLQEWGPTHEYIEIKEDKYRLAFAWPKGWPRPAEIEQRGDRRFVWLASSN